MIPPRPARFAFDLAPAGVEVKFIDFLADRPIMAEQPRMIAVHTNAAQREGSIESAWNWAHAAPGVNTIPHYQVDRSGRARKMLPSNVKGIANATVLPGSKLWPTLTDVERANIMQHPVSAAQWSLAVETADTGTLDDPTISDFTPQQVETVATILAYESITCGFPVEVPSSWFGAGALTHTDPFPFPYLTIKRGKSCPGEKKKTTFLTGVLPRAATIRAAWLLPEDEGDEMTPEQLEAVIAAVKAQIDAEVAKITSRLDGIEQSVQTVDTRLRTQTPVESARALLTFLVPHPYDASSPKQKVGDLLRVTGRDAHVAATSGPVG